MTYLFADSESDVRRTYDFALTTDGSFEIPIEAAADAVMLKIKTRLDTRSRNNTISQERYNAFRNIKFVWRTRANGTLSSTEEAEKARGQLNYRCHLTQRQHSERVTWSELDSITFHVPGTLRIVVYLQNWDDGTGSAEPRINLENPPEGVFHFIGTKKGLNANSRWEQTQEAIVADYIIDNLQL